MGANAKLVQQAYDAFGRGDIADRDRHARRERRVDIAARPLPHGGEFSGPARSASSSRGSAPTGTRSTSTSSRSTTSARTVVGVLRANGHAQGRRSPESYGAAHVFDVSNGKIATLPRIRSDL